MDDPVSQGADERGDQDGSDDDGAEITEDETPPSGLGDVDVVSVAPQLFEADQPGADDRVLKKRSTKKGMRRWIAYFLLWLLAGLAAVASAGWLVHGDDLAYMQSFGIIFSPIVTLVGTVLGFYFSSKRP